MAVLAFIVGALLGFVTSALTMAVKIAEREDCYAEEKENKQESKG